jgi:hypothetical protein
MTKTKIIALAAFVTIALSSCEELENLCNIDTEDLKFTEDYNQYLNAATYMYQITDRAMRNQILTNTGTAVIDGANCTRTPDSVIVDFGLGTSCADGKIRKGAFRMGYSGNYATPGSTIGFKLSGYQENDVAFTGEIGLTNISAGTPAYSLALSNISSNDAAVNGTITATWISGFATEADLSDDKFTLAGNMNMLSKVNSIEIVGTVLAPVLIDASCPFLIVEGQIELMPNDTNLPQAMVDFVPGDCANVFKTTVDCDGNVLSFAYPIK